MKTLKGSDRLRDAYPKMNDNFSKLQATKVDKISGRGLSENNYTDAEKQKVANTPNDTQQEINDLDGRIDNIIATPAEGVSEQEIIDARGGETVLSKRFDRIEDEIVEPDYSEPETTFDSVTHLDENAQNGRVEIGLKGETRENLIISKESAWRQGTLSSTGNNASATNRIRYFEVLSVEPGTNYSIGVKNPNFLIRAVGEFDEDSNYTFKLISSKSKTFKTEITTVSLRIVVQKKDESDIEPKDIESAKIIMEKNETLSESFIENGVKHFSPGRIRSAGKNLLKQFELGTTRVSDGALLESNNRLRTFVKLKGGTNYVRSIKEGYKNLSGMVLYDYDLNFYEYIGGTNTNIFSVPHDSIGVLVYAKIDDSPIRKDDFNKLQLEKGSVATEYEPYTETSRYYPPIPLRSLPNGLADEITDDGKHIKRVDDDGETELSEPIITELSGLGELQSHPNGTIYKENATRLVKSYDDGITTDLPIDFIESVTKLDDAQRIPIDLDDVSYSDSAEESMIEGYMKSDVSISGAEDGEIYEIVYFFKSEISTSGEMEYSYPINLAGALQSTSRVAFKTAEELSREMARQRAINLEFDFRISLFE